MPTDHERLHRLIEKLCIIEGDFVLSTGAKSRYYFDCKTVALDGEGLTLIAGEFLREIEKLPVKPTAIGGLPMGADLITAAVIMRSYQSGGEASGGALRRHTPGERRARHPALRGEDLPGGDARGSGRGALGPAAGKHRRARYRNAARVQKRREPSARARPGRDCARGVPLPAAPQRGPPAARRAPLRSAHHQGRRVAGGRPARAEESFSVRGKEHARPGARRAPQRL